MDVFINGSRAQAGTVPKPGERVIAISEAGGEDAGLMADILAIRGREGRGTRFESHEGFDYLSVMVADPAYPDGPLRRMEMKLDATSLVLVHDGLPAAGRFVEELGKATTEVPPCQALVWFFSVLTRPDAEALEDMEEEIANLEEEATNRLPDDCIPRIGRLRRRLLKLKRYYEGLYDALEDLGENGNELLDKKALRLLRFQTNRADRLRTSVLNLRDYVTQVREAYQNQLDLSQNETMKLFTVITAVFLPLTLIVGWYGMNLMMPEFNWPWAYPVVIVLSVAVVLGCLWVFKRKKWF